MALGQQEHVFVERRGVAPEGAVGFDGEPLGVGVFVEVGEDLAPPDIAHAGGGLACEVAMMFRVSCSPALAVPGMSTFTVRAWVPQGGISTVWLIWSVPLVMRVGHTLPDISRS